MLQVWNADLPPECLVLPTSSVFYLPRDYCHELNPWMWWVSGRQQVPFASEVLTEVLPVHTLQSDNAMRECTQLLRGTTNALDILQ